MILLGKIPLTATKLIGFSISMLIFQSKELRNSNFLDKYFNFDQPEKLLISTSQG